MIAKFKSPARAAVLTSAAVVVALCGFTFTRAADRKKTEAVAKSPGQETTPVRQTARVEVLKDKLDNEEAEVQKAEASLDKLRRELQISDTVDGAPPGFLTPETVRRLESDRITAQADYAGKAALLEGLKRIKTDKGVSELRKLIPTVAPDEVLSRLLQDLATTEATLAKLAVSHGPDNPEFKAVAAMQSELSKKVDERLEGIFAGLTLRAQASRAQLDSLQNAVQEARNSDAAMTEKYRPYLLQKRKLENLQKVRDAVLLRLLQETVDADLRPDQKPGKQ